MTHFISLFHFPLYSWPDPRLASSLLLSVLQACDKQPLLVLLLLLTLLQSPLMLHLAKTVFCLICFCN